MNEQAGATQEAQQTTQALPTLADMWLTGGAAVSEERRNEPVTTPPVTEQLKQQTTNEPIITTPQEEFETVEPNQWLKNKWGWENEEQADTAIKELRQKAEKAFEYKNEDSKIIAEYINEGKEDELIDILTKRKTTKHLSTADLSDKKTAEQLVKFGMKTEQLSWDDVDFLFSQKYNIPEKPTQLIDEDETDYEVRVKNWEQQVSNIEKALIIEAKMQQPKLSQLNNELVLAPIKREQTPQEPSQEDLQAFKERVNSFSKTAEQQISSFNGVSVPFKNDDVEFAVSYAPSKEEKEQLGTLMKTFAESGFDANSIFAERWVDEKTKQLNVEQMVKDLSSIYASESLHQKLVNDSANKLMDEYVKNKKQIKITGQPSGTFNPSNDKTKAEQLSDAFLAV